MTEPVEGDGAETPNPPPADDEAAGGIEGGDDTNPAGPDEAAATDDVIAAAATDEGVEWDPVAHHVAAPGAGAGEADAGGGWAVDVEDDGWIDADVVHDAPAVPLLPALAGRLEAIQGALATLAMRIDAVAAALGSFRATFGDRVDDYTETAAQLQRASAVELDEQRRVTERLLAELRRGVSDNDTALQRLAGRVDDVVTGVAGLVRRTEADQSLAPADMTLDEVGEAVAEHAAAALRTSFEAVRVELDGGEVLAAVRLELDALGGRLDAGLGAARDEVHLLKRRLAVRAKAPVNLDDAQLDAIADAVLSHLPSAAAAPDVDIDAVAREVAAQVIEHLDRRSEMAPDTEAKEEPAAERAARRRR